MTGTYLDFTGINLLTGFSKTVGEILLKNELGGVSNGYELVHAGGNSGYSFGGNQMDVSVNENGRTILRDILVNATDSNGVHIFIDGGVFYDENKTRIEAAGTPDALTTFEINQINSAIYSTYGILATNQAFANEVPERIAHVDSIINNLPTGVIKDTIISSEELRVFLNDYNNQFYISANGKMHNFLKGKLVSLTGGNVQLTGMIDAEDIIDFVSKTLWSQNNPTAFQNRYNSTEQFIVDKGIGKYIIGSENNDIINGGVNNDTINGGANNDTIFGSGGNDIIDGGAGFDVLDYSQLDGTDFINADIFAGNTYLNLGEFDVPTGAPKDVFANIEKIIGTGNGDFIYQDSKNLSVEAGGGADNIKIAGTEFSNADSIDGGTEKDTLTIIGSTVEGGDFQNVIGIDRIHFENDHTHVLEIFDDVVANSDNQHLEIDFSGAVSAGNTATLDASAVVSGGLTVIGGSDNDSFIAGSGNDILNGGHGNDTVTGGGGADIFAFEFESGAWDVITDYTLLIDKLDLNNETQITTEASSDGTGTLLYIRGTHTVELKNVLLLDFNNAWENNPNDIFTDNPLSKGCGGNYLMGTVYNDYLPGGGCNDTLQGMQSYDILRGGLGNDIYVYEAGHGYDDVLDSGGYDAVDMSSLRMEDIYMNTSSSNLTINTANSGHKMVLKNHFYLESQQIEELWLEEQTVNLTEGLYLRGNGPSSSDAIFGTQYNDTLEGGLVNDSLRGGDGDDTYVISRGGGNDDIIDTSGGDIIFLTDVATEELFFSVANDELWGYVDGNRIFKMVNQYDESKPNHQIEGVFTTDSIIGITGGLHLRGIYGDASEAFVGTRYNDTLEGGVGNDYMVGGAGNDTYIYAIGDGHDVINDSGGTLIMPGSPGGDDDKQVGDDRIITWDANNSLTILNYYNEATTWG